MLKHERLPGMRDWKVTYTRQPYGFAGRVANSVCASVVPSARRLQPEWLLHFYEMQRCPWAVVSRGVGFGGRGIVHQELPFGAKPVEGCCLQDHRDV